MKKLLIIPFLWFTLYGYAQETFPNNGPNDNRTKHFAFTNAKIHISPDHVIQNGTLIIKEGKVVSAQASNLVPKGAVQIDLKGKMIYPSFIELNSDYGIVHKERHEKKSGPQFLSSKKGAFGWNEAIRPELNAKDLFTIQDKESQQLRKLGFGAVLTHHNDGIVRGTGALVTLSTKNDNQALISPIVSNHFSFDKGSSTQDYPSSLMGAIALLRQTFYDANWYKQNKTETNLSLEAMQLNENLPAFFETSDVLDILRVNKLGKEFNQNFIAIGNGDEYQKIEDLKETNTAVVVPLKFPKVYDVNDVIEADKISLTDLKHWEMAPSNLSFLSRERIPFSVTSSKLEEDVDFLKNVRIATDYLGEKEMLRALTVSPAEFIGETDKLGTLTAGKLANFIITDGNIFREKDATIIENWVQGERFVINHRELNELKGTLSLKIDQEDYTLTINTEEKEPILIENDKGEELKALGSLENNLLSLSFLTENGYVRLNGWFVNQSFEGTGINSEGNPFEWNANFNPSSINDKSLKDSKEEPVKKFTKADLLYPFTGYGWTKQPKQQTILFKNATLWTNEKEGIIEQADILIQAGKIKKIGKNLTYRNAIEVDATGKHITSGIIDEHSHIAISRGVNEGTQASSAEVRIGDVIDSEHIGIYRVLAGGVTTSQLLHGSANPIGGQSAIIKSRWGLSPEELKFNRADEFIKFALGENVKQSNWGSQYNKRFPQTRMGVEQVFTNYFTLAKEYAEQRAEYPATTRRNLELEAIAEILNRKRFITSHSYVQSEINMLMNVAEKFGITVNTFTHILEGYKLADKLKEHGAGASTFSDWWGYKYEVIDAIPYNAATLYKEGIVTAINSDDAEMARRLNQEAAKTMKYGGLSQEEAWKTVTLNPAKLLHIDKYVGSLKVGKDADIVVWSDNPLSIYAVPEQTFVDGRKYYDREDSQEKERMIRKEKNRIIQKMLKEKIAGAPTQEVQPKKEQYYTCETIGNEGANYKKHNH